MRRSSRLSSLAGSGTQGARATVGGPRAGEKLLRNLLSELSKRVGVSAVAVAGLAIGGTAAAVVTSPTSSTEDVAPATTEQPQPTEATSSAPATLEAPAPVATQAAPTTAQQPVPSVPAATVGAVTEPVPAPAPIPDEPEVIGSVGEDGNYTPAPEPNMVPIAPPPPAPKGPSDPGVPPPSKN